MQIPLLPCQPGRSVQISYPQPKACLTDWKCQLLPRLAAGFVFSRSFGQQGRKFTTRWAVASLWSKAKVVKAHRWTRHVGTGRGVGIHRTCHLCSMSFYRLNSGGRLTGILCNMLYACTTGFPNTVSSLCKLFDVTEVLACQYALYVSGEIGKKQCPLQSLGVVI